ncbi:MAG: hypothetical protein IT323_15235 [Anaerolineae bacterium]|nr:hypothetical protein [Anaerolineae bacterium]
MKKRDRSVPPIALARRRAQALPGALGLTRFRSQLEIRFAQELEARGLRWFYEPERLGEGKYLLDFYLPDCRAWVEVKGVVDTRDYVVLREVAELVAHERRHRLYMWTEHKAYRVTAGDFHAMSHEAFWAELDAGRTPPNSERKAIPE